MLVNLQKTNRGQIKLNLSSKQKSGVVKISVFITSIFVIFISISYAFINQTLFGNKRQVLTSGKLELDFLEGEVVTLENALPIYDEVGMIQEPFSFRLHNKGHDDIGYTLKLIDVTDSSIEKLDVSLIRYGLIKDEKKVIDVLSNLENNVLDGGVIDPNQTISYELRLWIDFHVEDEDLINNKSLSYKIAVEAQQLKGTESSIVLDTGEDSPISKTVTIGYKYGSLPTPTKSGYGFSGWYNVRNEQITEDFIAKASDGKLTAKWTANQHTLTLNANGGTVSSTSKQITHNEQYGDLPTPTRKGYMFLGWYTTKTGGEKVESTTIFSNTSNQTLYAHWRLDVNAPELVSGMIPVTYNASTKQWLKADTNQTWYDYENQWWANAVTVTEATRTKYMNANPGTSISINDMNTMWVWIPRYEYQYTNLGEKYAGGTQEQPGEIKINFIKKTQTVASNSSVYKIPEGFKFGTENLSGFWMAKFETTGSISSACTSEACTTADLTILPNKSAVREQTVSSFFYASCSMKNSTNAKKYGFDVIGTGTMDVHMLKNTEWGIVAMLSQSRFGKYGNSAYTGANKEIYQNKSTQYITGNSNGIPSTNTYNTQVSYDTPNTGYGASTTGTIYGVYDMSGGAWEFVMGNYNQISGDNSSYNSGFSGTNGPTSGGVAWPSVKYYDLYTSDTASVGYKVGDATYEVSGWYVDQAGFLSSSYPWFRRGGEQANVKNAGIFSSVNGNGGAYSFIGTRFAIKP